MADEKKAPPQAKDEPEKKPPPARAAAPVEPEAAPAPAKPNLTQQQVEGFIQNQLCQKGMGSEEAAAEAKKRAAAMVR